MHEPPDRPAPQWSASPNAKARLAVQRSVTALLDALAPERVLKQLDRTPARVEQHRTPSGCVLQAADCAVSVSWFAEATKEGSLGELHVVVWRGKVTRRGNPSPKKATVIADVILHPIDPPADDCVWKATDGTRYDTSRLAERILALLEEQIGRQGS
jgi:hypothetical protein